MKNCATFICLQYYLKSLRASDRRTDVKHLAYKNNGSHIKMFSATCMAKQLKRSDI